MLAGYKSVHRGPKFSSVAHVPCLVPIRDGLDFPSFLAELNRCMLPTTGATRASGLRGATAPLIAQLLVPHQVVSPLGAAGQLVVRLRVLDVAETEALRDAPPSGDRFFLACAGELSCLIVEPPLAAAVVSRVLGLRLSVGTPLPRIERGIVTGALAALLSQLGLAPMVRMGEDGPSVAVAASIALAVDLGGRSGHAWLLATGTLLGAMWRRWPGFGSTSDIVLELAETAVATAELAGATVGDVVVFDGVGADVADAPCPVVMRRGGRRVPALWLADGALIAAEAAGPIASAAESPTVAGSSARDAVAPTMAQVIAACELGTGGLAWDGSLARARDGVVVLLVGGKPWARGEVRRRDGSFAVAISSMLAT